MENAQKLSHLTQNLNSLRALPVWRWYHLILSHYSSNFIFLLQCPLNIFLLEDLPVSESSSLGDSSTYLFPYLHASSTLFASRANSRSHRTQWDIPHALLINGSENGDIGIISCLFMTLHRRSMQYICLFFETGILSWLLWELLNKVQFLNMWNYTF